MKKNKILIGCGALLIIVLAWLLMSPSEEEVIKRRLQELSEFASKEQGKKGSSLSGFDILPYFHEDIHIEVEKYELKGKDKLRAIATRIHTVPGYFRVRFEDVKVEVKDEEATVTLTILLDGHVGRYGKTIHAKESKLKLVYDGDWLIKEWKEVKVFR